jgi:hypothetical protein
MKKGFLTIVIVLFCNFTLMGKSVFVSSVKSTLYKKASLNSDVVAKLHQNDSLDVILKKGAWYKVKYKNSIGWISKYLVKSNPISLSKSKNINFLQKKRSKKALNVRKRAYAITTAASARGLVQTDSNTKVKNIADGDKGVLHMESVSKNIDITQLETFNQTIK